MALKTFNLDNKIYKEFSIYCKREGISMSKRIENFIKQELGRIKGFGKLKGMMKEELSEEIEHSFKKYC